MPSKYGFKTTVYATIRLDAPTVEDARQEIIAQIDGGNILDVNGHISSTCTVTGTPVLCEVDGQVVDEPTAEGALLVTEVPAGATVTQFTFDGNRAGAPYNPSLIARVEPQGGAWYITAYNPEVLWNHTVGDWDYPFREGSYDAKHYERPLDVSAEIARRVVGLTT